VWEVKKKIPKGDAEMNSPAVEITIRTPNCLVRRKETVTRLRCLQLSKSNLATKAEEVQRRTT